MDRKIVNQGHTTEQKTFLCFICPILYKYKYKTVHGFTLICGDVANKNIYYMSTRP